MPEATKKGGLLGRVGSLLKMGNDASKAIDKVSASEKKLGKQAKILVDIQKELDEVNQNSIETDKAILDTKKKLNATAEENTEQIKELSKHLVALEKKKKSLATQEGKLADSYSKQNKHMSLTRKAMVKTKEAAGSQIKKWAAMITVGGILGLILQRIFGYAKTAAGHMLALDHASSGYTGTLQDLIKATKEHAKVFGQLRGELVKYGYTTQEVDAISLQFSHTLRDGTERSVPAIAKLTREIGILSKGMNVEFAEAAKAATDLSERFGISASKFPDIMAGMTSAVDATNKKLERFKIYNRDFFRSVMDAASGVQGYNIHMRTLQNIMSAVVVEGERFGLNQQQALKLSQTMAGLLTGKAPEWVRIMAGEDLVSTMLGVRRRGKENHADAMARAFKLTEDQIKKGVGKNIAYARKMLKAGKWGRLDAAEYLESLMKGTAPAIKATMKVLKRELGRMGPAAFRRVLGIEDAFEAANIQRLLSEGKLDEAVKKVKDLKKLEAKVKKEKAPISSKEYIRLHGKRIAALGTMKAGMEGILNRILAFFEGKLLPATEFIAEGVSDLVTHFTGIVRRLEYVTPEGILKSAQAAAGMGQAGGRYTEETFVENIGKFTTLMQSERKKLDKLAEEGKLDKKGEARRKQLSVMEERMQATWKLKETPFVGRQLALERSTELLNVLKRLASGKISTPPAPARPIPAIPKLFHEAPARAAPAQPAQGRPSYMTRIAQGLSRRGVSSSAISRITGTTLSKTLKKIEDRRIKEATESHKKVLTDAEKKRTKASDKMFKKTMPKQALYFWAKALDSQRKIVKNMMITMMAAQPGGMAMLKNLAPGWFEGLSATQRQMISSGTGRVRLTPAGDLELVSKQTYSGGRKMMAKGRAQAVQMR
jgi:DNA-binding IscR family transcriptional regulator